eukprot:scaffold8141_cov139-Skeletonema_dohrnii-CCMP3373.AAC.10
MHNWVVAQTVPMLKNSILESVNETYGRFSTLEGSTTSFLGAFFLVATAGAGAPSLSESSSAEKKLD